MTERARSVCQPALPRCRSRGRAQVGLVAFSLLLTLLFLVGCGDNPPPEETLAELGSSVGDAKLDDTDFDALIERYTAPAYADNVSPDFGNYQLYLTGKAADLALNQPEQPDLVEVEKDEGRRESRVSFNFSRKEGLFAVADISKIEVQLIMTEEERLPWKIQGITLSR
jgi:hypothetical protein